MVSLYTGLIPQCHPQVALGLVFLFSPRFWGARETLHCIVYRGKQPGFALES